MLSWLYGLAVSARSRLYRSGVWKTVRLPHPVVSVGNLTTGGTGKTPLVIYLARLLRDRGFHPAVLSRGYKGAAEKSSLLVSNGRRVLAGARESGDEAFLMAEKLPGVEIAVGQDRSRSAQLISGFGSDEKVVFLLDDAFQHLKLERDLNILVIDATDPFGSGRLLPFGRLREPLDGIKRADRVIITRAHVPYDPDAIETEIRRRHRLVPISYFYHDVVGLLDLRTRAVCPVREFHGKKVIAVSAIGNPEVFARDLGHYQLEVTQKFAFRDHHVFTQAEIDRISQAVAEQDAEAIVTTEKDAVRLSQLGGLPRNLYALQIEAKPEDPEEFDRSFLEDVRALKGFSRMGDRQRV